jgi:hypothetical protein
VPVRTRRLPKSPARHEWGVIVTGLRAKGWGSTMLRESERSMVRIGVAEGIFDVLNEVLNSCKVVQSVYGTNVCIYR